MANFEDFNYLNSVINKIFFNGRFNQTPIYLDIEDEYIEEISNESLVNKDELFNELSKAIITTIDWDHQHIYHLHKAKLEEWKELKYSEPPPFTGLLVMFSFAAEKMKSDENWSAINYFQRLSDLLKVDNDQKRIQLRNNSKFTRVLWESLNEWLVKNDYSFGIPTAYPVFKGWKYVSYAISQSLIRDVDRKNLRKLFIFFNLTEQDRLDGVIDKYLNHWMATTDPSNWLKRLWSTADLQEKIIETTLKEFEIWKVEQKETSTEKKNKKTNLAWVFSYKDFPSKEIFLYMTSSIMDFENSKVGYKKDKDMIIATDSAALYLQPYNEYGFSVLEPFHEIKINQLFNKSIELTLDDLTLNHSARPILIFSKMLNGMYQEVGNTSLFDHYAIICHKKFYESIDKLLKENCNDGYFFLDSNTQGIIDDWVIFLNVQFTKIPDNISIDSLKILAPSSEKLTFHYEGGLNLLSNIWHTKNPPNIICCDGYEKFPIAFSQSHETEKTLVDQNTSIKKQLLNIDNQGITFFGLNQDDKKILIEKDLAFRSANNPRVIPPELNKKIGIGSEHNSLYSADYISNEKDLLVLGYFNNFKNLDEHNYDLSKYGKYQIKGSFQEIEEILEYNQDKSNLDDEKSCIYRGYHVFKCPPDPRDPYADRNKHSMSEDTMECLDCGLIHPVIRKKNKRQGQQFNISNGLNGIDGKKNNFLIDDKKVNYDDAFDALCFLQCGKDYLFRKIIDTTLLERFKYKNLIDNLINLGHIEIRKSSNGLIDFWTVAPSVINIRDKEIYLSGFRNDDLVNRLDKIFSENLNIKLQKEILDYAPARIGWIGEHTIDLNVLQDLVKDIKNAKNESIFIMQETGLNLLHHLKSFDEYFSYYDKSNVDITHEFEKFNTTDGVWEKSSLNNRGAYRIKGQMNQYYFYDGEVFIYAPHDMVKIKAALMDGRIIHEYDRSTNEFRSLINTEPPGFYKKVLMSESGRVPILKNGRKIYSDISPQVGLMLMYKLYG